MWFEGRTWSWREVIADSGTRAHLALDLQVTGRPFHVGVLLENVPEYVLWMGGAALAGSDGRRHQPHPPGRGTRP